MDGELRFERFRYWQGQSLLARDFRAQADAVERLSRWHARAIHGAFGVRFGFDTELDAAGHVRVSCGVAYDCSGAVLALQRERVLSVPELTAGESTVLMVRDSRPPALCGRQDTRAVSPCGQAPLWEDVLAFVWSRARKPDHRLGVPLARLAFTAGNELELDASVRARVRPLARPRLAGGRTVEGLTPWEPWDAGVQTRVDTSAAGFTDVPCYVASLIGRAEPASLARRDRDRLARLSTHVFVPATDAFTFRIVVPPVGRAASRQTPASFQEMARRLGLSVCWLACQAPDAPPPECPGRRPMPDPCRDPGSGAR